MIPSWLRACQTNYLTLQIHDTIEHKYSNTASKKCHCHSTRRLTMTKLIANLTSHAIHLQNLIPAKKESQIQELIQHSCTNIKRSRRSKPHEQIKSTHKGTQVARNCKRNSSQLISFLLLPIVRDAAYTEEKISSREAVEEVQENQNSSKPSRSHYTPLSTEFQQHSDDGQSKFIAWSGIYDRLRVRALINFFSGGPVARWPD